MLSKKIALAVIASVLFTGCATTGTTQTAAQPAQSEQATNQQKTVGDYAQDVHQGSSAVQSAVSAIHSLKSIFKK